MNSGEGEPAGGELAGGNGLGGTDSACVRGRDTVVSERPRRYNARGSCSRRGGSTSSGSRRAVGVRSLTTPGEIFRSMSFRSPVVPFRVAPIRAVRLSLDRLSVDRSTLDRLSPAKWVRSVSLGNAGRWSLLAALVGLIVGVACVALEAATQAVGHFTLAKLAGFPYQLAIGEHAYFEWDAEGLSPLMVIAVMGAGGLVSGLLVYRLAPEAAGAGTDAATNAFHNRRGEMGRRVVWVKTLASAVTLGTGGSGGREGPIAQIGAGIGSWIASRMGLSSRDRRMLLAAGMGAGVGAMFRAPLAGAIFAAEILYSDSDLEADVIVPSAIASIIAYSVYSQSLAAEVRYVPIFGGGLGHTLGSPLELFGYAALAGALLFLAFGYVRLFHASQSFFERLPLPRPFRPAIGAAVAGVFGIALFVVAGGQADTLGVLGTGYGTLQRALTGESSLAVGMLLAVALVKMLTTSLTIGSGGSGGVFGPSMVIGGCAGGAFGVAVERFVPALAPDPSAYAVVGMAGFFSGVARSPISTIIMIRELTGDFGLIVPTMLVSTLMFLGTSRLKLYRSQRSTRLDSPAHRGDFLVDVLEGLQVDDVYRRDRAVMKIHEGATLDEIVHRLARTTQHYFPVVDDDGQMVGIFSDDDVRSYLYDQTLWNLAIARDVMTSPFVQVSPGDDLNTALQRFTALNLDELPVIDKSDPGRLLGFLRRKETIAAYNRRILEHRREAEQA